MSWRSGGHDTGALGNRSRARGPESMPRRTKDVLLLLSEGQIPILLGLMQGPIPAGLVLVIEVVLDSPATWAPKPGERSFDPAEHAAYLSCAPPTVLLARCKNKAGS